MNLLRFVAGFAAMTLGVLPLPAATADTENAEAAECVILLHGLARTSAAMEEMQEALTDEGYFVVNDSYPSREYPIEELAPMAIDPALEKCQQAGNGERVSFVTHSLGGILVRYYMQHNELDVMGRVVMLGPPNQGSSAADSMRNIPGFELLNGPAGSQLGKGEDSVPLSLGVPEFEFAVIAGNRTIDPVTSLMLPNPDDGKVSVADTRLEGMADFALVTVSHAYIMKDEEVIELVKQFLRDGRFEPAP